VYVNRALDSIIFGLQIFV